MAFDQIQRHSRSSSFDSVSSDIYPQSHNSTCRQVFVKGLHGRTLVFHFEVPPSPWELVDRVIEEAGLPAERLSLFFKGRRFNKGSTPLPNNATLHANINAYSSESEDEDDDDILWHLPNDENAITRVYGIDELQRQARCAAYVRSMWARKTAKH